MTTMEDNIKLREYRAITNSLKCWMLFVGLWPTTNPGIFYRAIPIFAITCNILLSTALFRFAIAHISSMNLTVKGLSVGTSFITIAFKISMLALCKERMSKLMTTIHKYHEESLADKNLRPLVLKNVTGFRHLSWIFCFLVFCTTASYCIAPIIFIMIQLNHHVEFIKYLLPLPAFYPWEIRPGGLLYKITYLFEAYNLMCLLFATCGIDLLFGYCVLHITGQLRVLGYQIMNLNREDLYHESLRIFVDKFQILKQCCQVLQTIYWPLILWQIITNSIIICTVLFQISQGAAISVGKYILILCYSGSKIMQTYLYASAGTALTMESEALTESVYFSDWSEGGDHRFRTSILIILAQKPLEIKAADFVLVSNEIFIMTLNTAISYFFLLKTFEEKQK